MCFSFCGTFAGNTPGLVLENDYDFELFNHHRYTISIDSNLIDWSIGYLGHNSIVGPIILDGYDFSKEFKPYLSKLYLF